MFAATREGALERSISEIAKLNTVIEATHFIIESHALFTPKCNANISATHQSFESLVLFTPKCNANISATHQSFESLVLVDPDEAGGMSGGSGRRLGRFPGNVAQNVLRDRPSEHGSLRLLPLQLAG